MLRFVFQWFLRIFVYIFVGTNVEGRHHLPKEGPALIVANHNSHLDTVVLLSLFPCRQIRQVHVAAAADYFFRKKWVGKLLSGLMGLIPISRKVDAHSSDGILSGVYQALDKGEVVILYPEGTRGEPGELSPLKNGISKVAAAYPAVPVVPVFLKGTETALPKGKKSFVPLIIQVTIHPGFHYEGNRKAFMDQLRVVFQDLQEESAGPRS